MSFSAQLRAKTEGIWSAAVGHRFVEELWLGTVPEPVISTYLAQDALFCDAFVALMGGAVSNADDPKARMAIGRQLGFVASDEDGYFTRALARLRPNAAPPAPLAPTRGFIDLMNEARRGDYASALVVLLVAEWLYLDWATPETPRPTPSDWVFAEWIDLHRGDAFEAWVDLLRSETDRVASTADAATLARMEDMFTRAVNLELAFFNAAYE
ncbi:uncharacterized protein EHS24_007855 [Apiotrichum porosum]|jgi:thiaminase/transcriptional activator TenA|uniref:Thiaminase-2/PQQC domain-containing protein n=1 Tax=Apiotrichum porosum TaxID=105984 RepID=A0A427XRY9_9TREE|nr:uncharacterized protein EHS24_007855 [Apiotrichum porosum]RSH81672.1 hypothetical protein EHS24_007855 [Apiotrichum porosum]